MKVTFRLSTDSSFQVTVPDNATVNDLSNAAKVGCPPSIVLPTDFKLIYNGEKLAPFYKLLSEFSISPEKENIMVILMNSADTPPSTQTTHSVNKTTEQTGARKKAKKNRCSFKSCVSAPLRMVGDCAHCQGKFCAKHRLLEDHCCTGLQHCKDNAHERNAHKLENESTITSRV